MKSIESYTKDEIIAAIRYKQKFDRRLIPALDRILAETRLVSARQEWKSAVAKSERKLLAFAEVTSRLAKAQGRDFVKLSELTDEERSDYIKKAEENDIAEREEQAAYKRLEKLGDEITGEIAGGHRHESNA